MTDIPDDVPRSPSGRVPKWVLDEAKGVEPTERVTFRGAATSVIDRPPAPVRGPSRSRRWLTVFLLLGITGGLVAGASLLDLSTTKPPSVLGGGEDAFGPPPGKGEEKQPLGEPAPLVGAPSTLFRITGLQADRTTPVTWSPCRPIHYVVRPDNAPADGPQLLTEAFAALSRATGLQFVDDGTTTESPAYDRPAYQKDRYGDRWAPVLITWATAAEVPDFGVDIGGEAGPQSMRTESGDLAYVTGAVALSARDMRVPAAGGDLRRTIILHELGHLAGLQHVDNSGQVMAPRGSKAFTAYQPGDLAGLAVLGTGPCQRDI